MPDFLSGKLTLTAHPEQNKWKVKLKRPVQAQESRLEGEERDSPKVSRRRSIAGEFNERFFSQKALLFTSNNERPATWEIEIKKRNPPIQSLVLCSCIIPAILLDRVKYLPNNSKHINKV
jgi:hypothetical protein